MDKKELLAAIKAAGPCEDGWEWASAHEGTAKAMLKAMQPGWLLWCAGQAAGVAEMVSAEQLDRAAKARPWEALRYAAKLLSLSQLGRAALAEPRTALVYAAYRLTPAQLDRAAKARPGAALRSAADRLSPEQRKRCERALG